MSGANTRNGFWTSLVVHALFFGLLGLMVAWSHFKKDPEPIIFEMVELPAEVQAPREESQQTPEPPSIDTPEIPTNETEEIPELNIPPEPEPTPTPPTPTPPTPPTPTPPTPTPPKQLSAADFFKEHGKPTPTKPKPPSNKPAPQIKVDTSDALKQLLDSSSSNSIKTASPAEQKALLDFIAKLRRQIELAWDKPGAIEGSQAIAIVRVTVQPNGTLGPVVLDTRSGSQLFDQSILNAVKRTRNIGGPPTGRAETINYTFRMSER